MDVDIMVEMRRARMGHHTAWGHVSKPQPTEQRQEAADNRKAV